MTSTLLADYERVSKLGEGTFGVVYKAIQRNSGSMVALKKVKFDGDDNGVPSTALREISVLKELKHPNIVELKNVIYQDCDNLQLVFEFIDFDLRKFMDKFPTGLPTNVVQSYMQQLLSGIDYCHTRRVFHRDLKPQNLLVNHSGVLKIADFGLARCFGIPMRAYTHEVVTLWYRAPEVLLGSSVYGIGVDMWSIGCIFAEMARNTPLLPGDSEVDQLFKTFELLGTPTAATWPDVKELPDWKDSFPNWPRKSLAKKVLRLETSGLDLLEKLLEYQPGRRVVASAALRHDYFKRHF